MFITGSVVSVIRGGRGLTVVKLSAGPIVSMELACHPETAFVRRGGRVKRVIWESAKLVYTVCAWLLKTAPVSMGMRGMGVTCRSVTHHASEAQLLRLITAPVILGGVVGSVISLCANMDVGLQTGIVNCLGFVSVCQGGSQLIWRMSVIGWIIECMMLTA